MWKMIGVLGGMSLCAAVCGQEDDPISGSASLGYLATSGNTESTSANAAFSLIYDVDTWHHEFDLSAVGASTDKQTTAEAYSASYKTKRDFSEQSYVFGVLDWNKDRFSGYERQVSESFGYGRRLLNQERHVLNAEVGAGARQAERRGGQSQDETILRASTDYRWIINETTEFAQDLIVESGSDNTYVESVSALKARLFGDIALVISYTIKNNSDVPSGSDDTDTFSAISLEYAF